MSIWKMGMCMGGMKGGYGDGYEEVGLVMGLVKYERRN